MASSSKDVRTYVAERFDTIAATPAEFKEFCERIGDARAPSRLAAKEAIAACSSVLDVGCGPGVFRATLDLEPAWPGHYVGVDTSTRMIEHALAAHPTVITKTDWVLHEDPSRVLPFAAGSFEAVVARHVLEHLDRPRTLLRELTRICERVLVLVFSQSPLHYTSQGIRVADQYMKVPRFAHLACDLLEDLEDWKVTIRRHDPRDTLSATGAGLVPREALWIAERR
jgi:ubiquinone/menaquinone biosynthesis C-methylase UbiE